MQEVINVIVLSGLAFVALGLIIAGTVFILNLFNPFRSGH